jgi:phosphoribosylglycinamide formyltransferase 1
MRTRFGVLISGNGSTLQSILDCLDLVDVAVVIASKPTAYGILRARRMGVPVEILPDSLKGRENRERAEEWIIAKLREFRVEKVFLAGYMRIISPKFIKAFEKRIFNIHPSLLPKHKGLDAFQAAIDGGDTHAGVTIHHVVEDVDSGEMCAQKVIEIPPHRDSKLSHLWLHINEQRMIRDTLRKIVWHDRLTS